MKKDHFKILIVDDEQEYREVLHLILKSKGFKTDMVSGADEAMEALAKNSYQLVLSDLIMKGKSGIELLEDIKRDLS